MASPLAPLTPVPHHDLGLEAPHQDSKLERLPNALRMKLRADPMVAQDRRPGDRTVILARGHINQIDSAGRDVGPVPWAGTALSVDRQQTDGFDAQGNGPGANDGGSYPQRDWGPNGC
jgi:hypothetical protein